RSLVRAVRGAAIAGPAYRAPADRTSLASRSAEPPRSLRGVEQTVDHRALEGPPGRLDDVRADADRGPVALAVGRGQQDAGDRARRFTIVEDAHLVVGQMDASELRVRTLDGSAQRGVDRVDRSVALRR